MPTNNHKIRLAKVDPLFLNKIKSTAIERIKNGVDKKLSREQASIRRFTKAMTRYEPLWKILKEAEFKE